MKRLLVALTMLGLAAAGCSAGEDDASDTSPAPIPVETRTATATTMPETYRYSGTLQGARRVSLSTKMMGTVTELTVDEGERVQQGQTLVRIRSQNVQAQRRQIEARLAEATAAFENAQTNFERIQALRKKDSATEKELDDAKTAVEQARARVRAMENQMDEINDMLTYATVTAPIDGYVVEKRIEQGAMATPGRPLLVVETIDALKAIVQVPERDVNRFVVGDSVAVEVGAAGNVATRGRITQVNPGGNAVSRQFDVHVRLDTDRADLKSGMYAQVLYRKGATEIMTVPASALVARGQLTGLYAVKDGRALLRWVRTGKTFDNNVEIVSGLRAGEAYVANASSRRLTDGVPIQ